MKALVKVIITTFAISSEICLARPVAGTAKFVASGTVPGLSIVGEGASLTGDLAPDPVAGLTGKVEAFLKGIKTGLELRDHHTQAHLETDKFPTAIMAISALKDGKFSGDLDLHGVKKPVTGTATQNGSRVEAKFTVNITDFGIKRPSHMGIGVEDEVEVQVSLDLKQ